MHHAEETMNAEARMKTVKVVERRSGTGGATSVIRKAGWGKQAASSACFGCLVVF